MDLITGIQYQYEIYFTTAMFTSGLIECKERWRNELAVNFFLDLPAKYYIDFVRETRRRPILHCIRQRPERTGGKYQLVCGSRPAIAVGPRCTASFSVKPILPKKGDRKRRFRHAPPSQTETIQKGGSIPASLLHVLPSTPYDDVTAMLDLPSHRCSMFCAPPRMTM